MTGLLLRSLFLSLLALAACSRTTSGTDGSGGSPKSTGGASGGTQSGGVIGSGGFAGKGGSPGTGGGGSVGNGGNAGSGGVGAGGTSGNGTVTAVNGGKTLSSLTPSEAAQLCTDTSAYFGKNISQATLCKEVGLTYSVSTSAASDAQLQKNCASQETGCLQAGSAVADCTSISASCTATVAQYSTCIVDKVAAFNQTVNALASCATATLVGLTAVWDFIASDPPASCGVVTGKCPTLDLPAPVPGPVGSGGVGGGSGGGSGSGGAGGAGGSAVAGAGGTAAKGGSTGNGGSAGSGGAAGGTGGGTAAGGSTSPSTSISCTGTASATAANTLTVDVDSAKDVIGNGIFGLLMEQLGRNWKGGVWVGTGSTTPNTDGMRNDIIDGFKEAGVGMIEWPGGCAAGGYNWSSNKNPSNDVGTDRYMKLCQLLGIEPLIVGPGTAAAAANNLAWVTYINQNSTHTDWTLPYFKVGNEVWGCGGNQDEATYETNYLANYDKLSVPVNGKKVKIIASTGLIGNWTWFDAEVKNLVGKIDGVEIHDYIYHPTDIPCVGFTDNQYYDVVNAANAGQMGPRIDRVLQTLDQYDPSKSIKIYEDEWGDWLEPFDKASDSWLQQGTVMDAISAAETLHLFIKNADRYQMAGLAQGVNVIHSLLLTKDSALVKTPTFYVFKMFLPHHRANAKWAPGTLKSENITGNSKSFPVLSSVASVDDQGHVNVSLANVDLVNSRTIQITLSGGKSGYDVTTAQVVTGPAKDSYNDFGKAEVVNIQSFDPSKCSLSGKTLQVTLPPKSVVMVVLTPKA